jgi:DNA polymerase III subunit epsilon
MSQITVYGWWGNSSEPPPHLKTQKQLASMGLKPVKPVGVIYTPKYDLYLYDPDNSESATPKRKASDAQLKALAKGREKQQYKAAYQKWYKYAGQFIEAKNYAIQWAKEILDGHDWLILDTETTGLYDAEIVQIGIINLQGEIILDSLVKPTIFIPEEVIAIHGITNEAVANAPSFPEIYPQIVECLSKKQILIYNTNFDTSILDYCCRLHILPLLNFKKITCVMEWYAQYYGEWSDYYKSYKWQALAGNHNAIGDCLTTLDLIKSMANSEIIDLEAEFKKYFSE